MRHLLSFALVALAAAPALAQDTDAELRANITTSTVDEDGTSVDRGRAEGVVDQPIERVMQVLQDYGQYAEFLPEFRQSRVLSRRGTRAMVYLEVGALHQTVTLWAQVRISSTTNSDGSQEVVASMTQGNLERFAARWVVRRVDENRTQVSIEILAEPDIPAPSNLVTTENVRMARKSVIGLRRYMRSMFS